MKNNPNHLKFVNEYLKNGHNATKAYMAAYPLSKYSTAAQNSYQLLKKPKVRLIIDKETQEYSEINKETLKNGIVWALNQAKDNNDYQAYSKIAMDAARITGLLINKHEDVTEHKEIAAADIVAELRRRAVVGLN